jgi:cytochrome c2
MRHLLSVLLVVSALSASGQERSKKTDKPQVPAPSPWGDFVEKDFPFFSSVLDGRDLGEGFSKDNLTPRGLILNLGHNLWACFDTELLRIACIWEGVPGKPPVTPEALAPGSYHIAGQKTKDGQDFLPKPVGKVWLANGIYPGWQAGDKPSFTDPREPGPSQEEVGRGPLKESQFKEIATIKTSADKHAVSFGGWEIRYSIAGTEISERWSVSGVAIIGNQPRCNIERMIVIQPHRKPLNLILGRLASGAYTGGSMLDHSGANRANAKMVEPIKGGEADYLQLEASNKATELHWSYGGGIAPSYASDAETFFPYFDRDHWPKTVITKAAISNKADAYVLDDIPLPVPNPWKRNVRLADLAFLNDQGDAAGVTFDGDVWLISGLKGDLENVTWKRFASGLHEPMSLVARAKEHRTSNVEHPTSKDQSSALNVGSPILDVDLFIFDRSGIWKLVDTNNDGEADRYEMFCNLFAQTAETREFPNSMKLGPDGSLYLSKGGQEGTTFGKHNGTVIKVASDGKKMEVIGYGLRQPFIGVHPKTGLVTASDQQGNYVPSTPIHIIRNNQFYGHLPGIAPKEIYPAPITEPLTWIPHPVNPSGATQVWLTDARMGPINDELIHIGYNRPELFRVMMNTRFKRPQAAVMSFERDLDFGPLNAHVNPADGQLYVVGFQVWGTTAKKLSGLARLRYTDKPRVLLKEVTPTDQGLILRFNSKLDAKLATDPASYSAERWNYKRTAEYGSPHLKLDGSTGQEWLTASSAYLSKDGMSVFVGIPDMKAGVHQMRIGWGLKSADGLKAENTAYFSPWELMAFDPAGEGFGEIKIDLSPRQVAAVALVKPTLDEGARLYQMIGCMACHSTDGSTVGKVGPSWKGIFGTERVLGKGGKSAIANEAYLRESITNPSAKVVKGFEKFDTGMPIYAGILNESQIESLVLFIKSLK